MKNFYTIIGLIGIFFFTLPMRLFAATEYNPDAVEVDILPECNQSVVDNVYANNNHYYKCNYIPGELRNIQVGDVLKDMILYFSFPDDIYASFNFVQNQNINYLVVSENSNTVSPTSGSFSNSEGQIYVRTVSNKNLLITVGGFNVSNKSVYTYINRSLSMNLAEFDLSSNSSINSLFVNPIAWVDVNNPAYQYIKISTEGTYSYEDQGEIPVLYTYEDKDFYLFYDFGMIANLDIFSNYDFTSFTDYQKVVVVIGFNIFYIAILCFFGAIIYKALARIIRFILG